MQRIRALLYHDIVASAATLAQSGFAGADSNAYKLNASDFAGHLDAIDSWARSATQAVEVGGLLRTSASPIVQVIFTFDDAGSSSIRIADLLEAKGWKGHFFAPTDFVGTPNFLSAAELRDLARRGHAVGSHSVSHPLRMAELAPRRILAEWKDSLASLSDMLGVSITTASVPGGMYSSRVRAAALEAGVTQLFTSEPRQRLSGDDGMPVCGRYALLRLSSANEAVAIARGDRVLLLQKRLFWDAKKAAKWLVGPAYLKVRKRWFEARENADSSS